MKLDTIIKMLKAHKLVLNSEDFLKDGQVDLVSPRQVWRGSTSDRKEKFGQTKPHFRIPKWPKSLAEVCSRSLWRQVRYWKQLVNRSDLNQDEKIKLCYFEIRPENPDSKDERDRSYYSPHLLDDNWLSPSDRATRERDRNNSSSMTHFNTSGRCDHQYGTHSPWTNRHSYDDRRVCRRVHYDSYGSYSKDYRSAYSEESGAITSRHSHREDDCGADPAAWIILMGWLSCCWPIDPICHRLYR